MVDRDILPLDEAILDQAGLELRRQMRTVLLTTEKIRALVLIWYVADVPIDGVIGLPAYG